MYIKNNAENIGKSEKSSKKMIEQNNKKLFHFVPESFIWPTIVLPKELKTI